MPRITLRERFFPLHQPDEVDGFLERFPWSVVFKAGTSDKTVDAWLAARATVPAFDGESEPRWGLAYSGPGGRPRSSAVFENE